MGLSGFFGRMFGPRSSGPAPTADETVLRAYGKLPFYPEYRRLEISPGPPTLFSRWMDDGRLAWCRSPKKTEHGVTRPSRVVLRLADAKEIVVASIWDSRDSAGRVFPFAFFVTCAPEALGAEPIEQWVAAQALFREFDQYHGVLGSLAGGGDFYRCYQKRNLTLRRADTSEQLGKLRQEAVALSTATWFRGWAPDGRLDPAAWFASMQRRTERWAAQRESAAELAVSCPLASGVSNAAQTVCWLTLLNGLSTRAEHGPAVIAPGGADNGGGTVHLLLRDVLADDFQLLTSDADRYGFVENLASLPQGAGAAWDPLESTCRHASLSIL